MLHSHIFTGLWFYCLQPVQWEVKGFRSSMNVCCFQPMRISGWKTKNRRLWPVFLHMGVTFILLEVKENCPSVWGFSQTTCCCCESCLINSLEGDVVSEADLTATCQAESKYEKHGDKSAFGTFIRASVQQGRSTSCSKLMRLNPHQGVNHFPVSNQHAEEAAARKREGLTG